MLIFSSAQAVMRPDKASEELNLPNHLLPRRAESCSISLQGVSVLTVSQPPKSISISEIQTLSQTELAFLRYLWLSIHPHLGLEFTTVLNLKTMLAQNRIINPFAETGIYLNNPLREQLNSQFLHDVASEWPELVLDGNAVLKYSPSLQETNRSFEKLRPLLVKILDLALYPKPYSSLTPEEVPFDPFIPFIETSQSLGLGDIYSLQDNAHYRESNAELAYFINHEDLNPIQRKIWLAQTRSLGQDSSLSILRTYELDLKAPSQQEAFILRDQIKVEGSLSNVAWSVNPRSSKLNLAVILSNNLDLNSNPKLLVFEQGLAKNHFLQAQLKKIGEQKLDSHIQEIKWVPTERSSWLLLILKNGDILVYDVETQLFSTELKFKGSVSTGESFYSGIPVVVLDSLIGRFVLGLKTKTHRILLLDWNPKSSDSPIAVRNYNWSVDLDSNEINLSWRNSSELHLTVVEAPRVREWMVAKTEIDGNKSSLDWLDKPLRINANSKVEDLLSKILSKRNDLDRR
jgi:hypothetical protein